MITEQIIEAYYQAHDIYYPHEIDLDNFAVRLHLDVFYLPRSALLHSNIVVIDERAQLEEQHEQLAHEIAHHILHHGNQTKINTLFRTLQEEQARRLMLVILAPSYMLDRLWSECPQYLEHQIAWLAGTFSVTYECMAARLRLYQSSDVSYTLDR